MTSLNFGIIPTELNKRIEESLDTVTCSPALDIFRALHRSTDLSFCFIIEALENVSACSDLHVLIFRLAHFVEWVAGYHSGIVLQWQIP